MPMVLAPVCYCVCLISLRNCLPFVRLCIYTSDCLCMVPLLGWEFDAAFAANACINTVLLSMCLHTDVANIYPVTHDSPFNLDLTLGGTFLHLVHRFRS